MKQKRILISIHHPLALQGGAPGVTRALAHAYREMGHEVDIISFEMMPPWAQGKVSQFLFPWFVAYYVRKYGESYNVLDLSSGDGWLIHRRRLDKTVLVTRRHGLEHIAVEQKLAAARSGQMRLSLKYPIYHGGWRLREVARSFRKADIALFLNRTESAYAVDQLGIDRDRVILVPNGLPDAFLDLPMCPRRSDGPVRVVMLGPYLHHKGYSCALPALARLMERHNNLEVRLIGTGAVEPQKHLVSFPKDRYEIIPRYRHGDLPSLLKGAHILLFPSLAEGFPLSALEGMAAGLTLVTTTVGGLAERLVDDRDALLIPPGDSDAIEQAVESLIEDPEKLERLRAAAHAKAQDFSWRQIASDVISFYGRALEKRQGGAVA